MRVHDFVSSFHLASRQAKKANTSIKKYAGLLMVNRAKYQNPAKTIHRNFALPNFNSLTGNEQGPILPWN
jgi:hypothetical protein